MSHDLGKENVESTALQIEFLQIDTPYRESYKPKLNRRESLKWLGVALASTAIPLAYPTVSNASEKNKVDRNELKETVAAWPDLALSEIKTHGYGQDPDLIAATVPWPLTLSPEQLDLVARLSEILIPAEGNTPSASAVGVPDVIDEWISAPYPQQQQHRTLLLSGLVWIDSEASRRYGMPFVKITTEQQLEIVDAVAFSNSNNPALTLPVTFFSGLRYLVVGFFFTTPEGVNDLGYIGNKPIKGEYPGPTPEALKHLDGMLDELGLSL